MYTLCFRIGTHFVLFSELYSKFFAIRKERKCCLGVRNMSILKRKTSSFLSLRSLPMHQSYYRHYHTCSCSCKSPMMGTLKCCDVLREVLKCVFILAILQESSRTSTSSSRKRVPRSSKFSSMVSNASSIVATTRQVTLRTPALRARQQSVFPWCKIL